MTEQELHNLAIGAADKWLASIGESADTELGGLIHASFAAGWVEGRYAGGQEALNVVRMAVYDYKAESTEAAANVVGTLAGRVKS